MEKSYSIIRDGKYISLTEAEILRAADYLKFCDLRDYLLEILTDIKEKDLTDLVIAVAKKKDRFDSEINFEEDAIDEVLKELRFNYIKKRC